MNSVYVERFWPRVARGGCDDCWEWLGGRTGSGYGRARVAPGVDDGAHRVAYELLVGPIPAGFHLDHLCRNPICVNPAHLEPVPPRVNLLRGVGACAINATKTHCGNGHEFTPENTYLRPKGGRDCRICKAARERNRGQRKEVAR